jgi:hypothetical protein
VPVKGFRVDASNDQRRSASVTADLMDLTSIGLDELRDPANPILKSAVRRAIQEADNPQDISAGFNSALP